MSNWPSRPGSRPNNQCNRKNFMQPNENYEGIIPELSEEIDSLKETISDMNEFFSKLSVPLFKKAIRDVEKQLRYFLPEAKFFGDGSNLNLFEEVCAIMREGSLDDQYFLDETIVLCCESSFYKFSYDEKFIMNHQPFSHEAEVIESIKSDFYNYALNYISKRIDDAYERRNLWD
jgi:hypothetical protein